MTERPILFSAPMVRALLAGHKTQTRRVLKPQPDFRGGCGDYHDAEEWGWEDEDGYHVSVLDIAPNGYAIGDRLWVRESIDKVSEPRDVFYRADYEDAHGNSGAGLGWKPSIHMPRWASRLTLIVTDVRVQRLKEISRGDAMEEGCPFANMAAGPNPIEWFADLWKSIHGHEAWDANPWVCALTFTVHRDNIDSISKEA